MANLFAKFRQLLPDSPLLIGLVQTTYVDHSSKVELLGGGVVRVRGDSVTPGNYAFVQNGEITGEAPGLTHYDVEV